MATIYKIYSTKGPEVYIGSTVRPLNNRWSLHKGPANTTSSKVLFDLYGIDSCKIEAIEEVKVEEAASRERHWILESNAINERCPSVCSKTEYKKKWYEENRDRVISKAKEHIKKQTYRKEKVLCECGRQVNYTHLAEHKRSTIHKSKMTIQKE